MTGKKGKRGFATSKNWQKKVSDTDRRRVAYFKQKPVKEAKNRGGENRPAKRKKSIINVLRERIARFLTYLWFGRLLMIHAVPAFYQRNPALHQKLTVPKAWVLHGEKHSKRGVFSWPLAQASSQERTLREVMI